MEVLGRVVIVPGGHREQVPHAHRGQVRARFARRLGGEEGQDRIVHRQPALGDRHPDRVAVKLLLSEKSVWGISGS